MSTKKKLIKYRKYLNLCPKNVKYAIYRSNLVIDSSIDHRLELKIASTKDELDQAFTLLHDEYVKSGFMEANTSKMRITKYQALPSTAILIAKLGDEVVGTVSIVKKDAFGLPMSTLFDLSKLEKGGKKIAEISSLSVKKSYQSSKGIVLFPLLKYLYTYARNYLEVDTIAIVVNPKHIQFYEAFLGFKRLDRKTIANYGFANGNPGIAAYLNFEKAYSWFGKVYKDKPVRKNLFKFFVDDNLLIMNVPPAGAKHRSIMPQEILKYYFEEVSDVIKTLEPRERAIYEYYKSCAPRIVDFYKPIKNDELRPTLPKLA